MRDKIKSKVFFEKSLSFTTECINDFEKIMPTVIEKQGENSEGAINGYNALVIYYIKRVNLLYSLGKSIQEIKEDYNKLLNYYAKVWKMDYGYIELVRIISLGILLNINNLNSDFKILENKIKKIGLNDYLLDFLLKSVDSEWELSTETFAYKGIYEDIKAIIENPNGKSKELLKEYLNDKWYEIHNETAWYDSHNSKQNTYYGYWAYEAGAICKILRLDDEELKEQQYYPYDLVHFNE